MSRGVPPLIEQARYDVSETRAWLSDVLGPMPAESRVPPAGPDLTPTSASTRPPLPSPLILPPWPPQNRLRAPSGGGLPSAAASPPSGTGTDSAGTSAPTGVGHLVTRPSKRGLTDRDVAPPASRGRRKVRASSPSADIRGSVSIESFTILQAKELPNLPGAAPTLRQVPIGWVPRSKDPSTFVLSVL